MPRKFEASDEQRQRVRALAGYGLKQEQIAVLVGVKSTATLRKHFHPELVRGPIEAQHNVRRTLFKLATSGRNPGVTMYWLKRWGGWRKRQDARTGRSGCCRAHLENHRVSAATGARAGTAASASAVAIRCGTR